MLPLILAAALSAPSPAPADGTYTYLMSMNGSQIGTTAVTVTRDPLGNVVLSESESGTMNGRSGAIKDTLKLGPTLSPLQYLANASIADSRNMKTVLAFKGDEATQSGDVTKTYDLVASAKHFVVLDFGPFTGYFAFPAQMQAWDNQPVVAIIPMYAQGMPISVDQSIAVNRPQSVPAADAHVTVASPVQFTMWYDPKTLVVDELDVPAEGVQVVRKG